MDQKTKGNEQLTIKVHSRIHFTLLAMHKGEYRINGGLGFAIDNPNCELTFSSATNCSITDNRIYPLAVNEQEKLIALLQTIRTKNGFANAVEIVVDGNMYPHAGFGSGTAITLACLEALHKLNGFHVLADDLAKESGRGGTSGVGIHTTPSPQRPS